MDEEWRKPAALLLCLVLFAVLAAFNLGIALQMPPTGDEPHYLITARSLAYDHDLSLRNDYLEKHYRAFYPGELAKRTTPSADGKTELPAEGLGLSFLLAPVYRAASEILPPAWLVPALRLFMCSITTIILYTLLTSGIARGAGFCLAAFLCSPLLFYSGQFYPEIPAALVLALALNALRSTEEHSWNALAMLSLAPGALVWLHPKYVALAAALLLASVVFYFRTFRVYRQFRHSIQSVLLLLLGAAGIVSLFVFLHSKYGGWSPNRIYAGWEPEQQKTLLELLQQEGIGRITVMFRMFFGFWIDQRFGLLIFAPFYVAFFSALVWMLRRRVALAVVCGVLFAAHFAALCWGAPLGGFAPPSRHLVVLVPLFLSAILTLHGEWKRAQRSVFYALMCVSLLLAGAMALHYRALFTNLTWREPGGYSPFWQLWHLEAWLPQLTAADPTYLLTLCWTVLFAALSWLLYPRLNRSNSEENPDSFAA